MLKPKDILEFWFGTLDDEGLPVPEKESAWFRFDRRFDQLIRRRFLSYVMLASENGLPEWEQTAQGRLALILLLDQFTRNIFRGTAMAFEHDRLARQFCREGLKRGDDVQMPPLYRVFFYLPLEHSERMEDQNECVALLEQLHAACQGAVREKVRGFLKFALEHQKIIERFGRFPHRNALLQRPSTAEEITYLENGARRFGQ